jgi:hypothetical protein
VIRRTIAAAAAVIACAGCAGPTLTDHAMRSQASRSAESAVSEVETIRLAVQTQLDGNAWWQFTDILVTDSETALSSIESTLSSRQPPSDETAQVRNTVVAALGDAVDLAAATRIAVRSHDDSRLEQLVSDLGDMSNRLSKLEESVK